MHRLARRVQTVPEASWVVWPAGARGGLGIDRAVTTVDRRAGKPMASLALANPRAASSLRSSPRIRNGALGSLKIAVPTCTAVAPAAMNSKASAPVRIPPTPMIGDPGQCLRDLPDRAHRDRPDRRPRETAGDAAELRTHRVEVDVEPSRVLIMTRPSAPASITDSGDLDDARHVGRELGEDREPTRRVATYAGDDPRGLERVAGKDQPAVLDVGARDVDLDRGDAGGVADPSGELGVLPQGRARRSTRSAARRAAAATAGRGPGTRRCPAPAARSS